MWNPRSLRAALSAGLFSLPFINALAISVPPCISQCIDQSTDDSCSVTDLKCICRESNGRFLPDVVLCMHGSCDSNIDVGALLTPLSLACDVVGTPISPSALANAQSQASQVAYTTTITVTQIGSVAPTSIAAPSGQAVVTVTASAGVSTATQVEPGNTRYTGLVPVIVVGTNSAGSAYTSTTTVPGAISTITMTNSAGSIATVVSTFTQPGGTAVGVIVVQTLTTTNSAGSIYTITQSSTQATNPVNSGSAVSAASSSATSGNAGPSSPAAQSATASQGPTKSSTNPNAENTDSTPFGVRGSANRQRAGSLLGLVVILIIGSL